MVTYNRLDQLKTTLSALLAEVCDHIIIVDNGSTDGSRKWLAAQVDPRLHVLETAENLGGAGGFEAGLRLAVKKYDPDWVVVMDDDARPAPGALAAFHAADKAGWDAVAGAVYYPDGRICDMNRPSVNPFWNTGAFFRTLLGGGRMGFHLPDRAYGGTARPVDAASFVGLFIARHAIMRAGYPDGRLFLYGDDVIYTLGLRKSGLTIGFDPVIRFEHDCTTFTGDNRIHRPVWKVYYNYRNGLIMYRAAAGWLFWPALLVVLPKWALKGRHYKGERREFYRLLWRAVRDGVTGQSQ